jgi:hypothetical protein
MALVQIADVVVPQIFNPYVQQITEEKSRLIQSGALVRDGAIDVLLPAAASRSTSRLGRTCQRHGQRVHGR